MTGIYIKQSERVCEESGFKCFDIYDQDKKLIDMIACDVVQIELNNVQHGYIMFEIVDDMIHIWSMTGDFEVEQLVNTFTLNYKSVKERKS